MPRPDASCPSRSLRGSGGPARSGSIPVGVGHTGSGRALAGGHLGGPGGAITLIAKAGGLGGGGIGLPLGALGLQPGGLGPPAGVLGLPGGSPLDLAALGGIVAGRDLVVQPDGLGDLGRILLDLGGGAVAFTAQPQPLLGARCRAGDGGGGNGGLADGLDRRLGWRGPGESRRCGEQQGSRCCIAPFCRASKCRTVAGRAKRRAVWICCQQGRLENPGQDKSTCFFTRTREHCRRVLNLAVSLPPLP
jgi:hypothetical protein